MKRMFVLILVAILTDCNNEAETKKRRKQNRELCLIEILRLNCLSEDESKRKNCVAGTRTVYCFENSM